MSTDTNRGDAMLRVDVDHPCLAGHFPGHPLVPGVMLLEQVARWLRAHHGLRVTRIVEAKFLAPLEPGREAQVCVSGEPPRLRFEIRAGERLIARGRVEAGP
jgi:3-hydroxymyristoyl/3-hydroxydecanoyl-(acyl carrier protein) dehydratase